MLSCRKLATALLSLTAINVSALSIGGTKLTITHPGKRETLQDLVTWDEHPLFVRGERMMFYSGEFHPWRLPVPGLWLDVFQKIKALGYTGVSFYVDWWLLEGNKGHFTAEGVFAWEPFFAAASEAGIYLLARPGPYINAEVAGGGFPGWLQRNPSDLRTNETKYTDATQNYITHMGKLIADAQITNGGHVILFQSENEYTYGASWVKWPDVEYIERLNKQWRDTGIVVPFVNNEAAIIGLFTPGKPGGPDIYGHDSYPGGFDCSDPSNWTASSLATNLRELHLEDSPNTPYAIPEFQGGAIDSWGSGIGLDGCAALINNEFERVFYKNNFAAGITIFNFYMTYGGTNWDNLGESGGYTSYDYGAAIREDRRIDREKYVEAKLEAQFITASPAYLTAVPGNVTNGSYASTSAIATTPVLGNTTGFYIVRHADYRTLVSTDYTFTVSTSIGNVTVPQLGGSLTLNVRDSKIHVTDYEVAGINPIYSSAEVYTHSITGGKRVLLLYSGAGETHELAFSKSVGKPIVEGGSANIHTKGKSVVVQWEVTLERKILHYGSNLDVYLLWRNDAYNYWPLELEAPAPISNYSSQQKEKVIVKAGYLMRTAVKKGTALYLTGDLNTTADFEVVVGLPGSNNVYFNGEKVHGVKSANCRLTGTLTYTAPSIDFPQLSELDWKYLDSLPEIKTSYDDSGWTAADIAQTNNTYHWDNGTLFQQVTPTSLIAGDYGYQTGSLIYRGYFTAAGNESTIYLSTVGGAGYGHSVWINSTYIGYYAGNGQVRYANQTLTLPQLAAGKTYVITVLIDHMGLETNWTPGYNTIKQPRGIIDYFLAGHEKSGITWKLTGNLGGEQYVDKLRGPLNEGGMYAERQGYHQPNPPSAGRESSSPIAGINKPGIGFYTACFDLHVPAGYDVPMSFVFTNTTSGATDYRVQLYVNGYQFGKYVNNLGPQIVFPVPEGILNYDGENTVSLALWAMDAEGASLAGIALKADAIIQSGMQKPALSPQPAWRKRPGSY